MNLIKALFRLGLSLLFCYDVDDDRDLIYHPRTINDNETQEEY